MRTPYLLLLFAVLTACVSGPYPVTSPYYRIPAGSKIVLKQELTIPPAAGRVYIQYGKVITPKERNQYYAHCWFLSWQVLETAQIIKPDTFLITASQKFEDIVQHTTPAQIASRRFSDGLLSNYSSPSAIEYSTELTIHSDAQPQIRRLVCSHWENPEDGQHLTVAQMQQTLGGIAVIQLLE